MSDNFVPKCNLSKVADCDLVANVNHTLMLVSIVY